MKIKSVYFAAAITVAFGVPSASFGYDFPTNMQVSMERGPEPLYKLESSVDYPIESYFSVDMPNGEKDYVLEQNGDGVVPLVQEGGRLLIQRPVSIGDEFYFAPNADTSTRPIRLVLSGPINIGHIHFAPGSAKLSDSARIVLSEIANQMKTSGLNGAYLVGRTDRSGSADANLALSEKRAIAVAKYLNRFLDDLGMVGAEITYESMGEYESNMREGSTNPFDRKVSVMLYPAM